MVSAFLATDGYQKDNKVCRRPNEAISALWQAGFHNTLALTFQRRRWVSLIALIVASQQFIHPFF